MTTVGIEDIHSIRFISLDVSEARHVINRDDYNSFEKKIGALFGGISSLNRNRVIIHNDVAGYALRGVSFYGRS